MRKIMFKASKMKKIAIIVFVLVVLVSFFVLRAPAKRETLDISPQTGLSQVSLGFKVNDAKQVDFFNLYALPQDTISAGIKTVDLLKEAKTKNKSLIYGGEITTEEAIAAAKTNGISLIFLNQEHTRSAEDLAKKEKEAYTKIKAAGLKFGFVPTGRMLAANYQSFVYEADIIGYQTQSIQTEANYEQTVSDLIAKMKALNPRLEIWVQVSVNPPGDRTISADKVINSIRSLSGTTNNIKIFFNQESDRYAVMQEVFKTTRNKL